MFMSLFVIYGFDTAGDLAEETKNPRREAPRAVLGSVIGAFVIGGIFLYACLLAIPDLDDAIKGAVRAGGHHRRELRQRVLDGLPARRRGGDLRLLPLDPDLDDPPRLRDGARRARCPARRCSRRFIRALHTPVGHVHRDRRARVHPDDPVRRRRDHRDRRDRDDLPRYLVGNIALLRARLRGWPKAKAPFSLGRWGLPVNVLALAWGGGMLVNFAWPRVATNPTPVADRPRPRLPLELAEPPAGALDCGRRDSCSSARAYFFLVQRRSPAHLQAPEGEVFADELPPAVPT